MVENDEQRAAGDDEYIPDPDAPKDAAARHEKAMTELDLVTRIATGLAAAATIAAWLLGSAALGKGVLLGSMTSILNLRVLARVGWTMLSGSGDARGALAGFLGSFALLIGAAAFVAFVQPTWTLGFGLGLAMPAAVGVAWAVWPAKKP